MSDKMSTSATGVRLADLLSSLAQLLSADEYKDYCPNGLQVEGRAQVRKIVCGVSANLALIKQAIERKADAVLVHHGWFWQPKEPVVGYYKERMRCLLLNDISLIAYHLPLDGHPELGNNAQLARLAGWRTEGRFGAQNIGFIGQLEKPVSASQMCKKLEELLSRKPLLVGNTRKRIKMIAWCSGGAQGMLEQAVELGVDAYVSGEISEYNPHVAAESNVAYIAAGHHATERFGIQALGNYISERFPVLCEFIDIDNPA